MKILRAEHRVWQAGTGVITLLISAAGGTAFAQSGGAVAPATTLGGEQKHAPAMVPSGTMAAVPAGKFVFSGSMRNRTEFWDYFEAPGFDDSYTFNGTLLRYGALRQTSSSDMQFEIAAPLLLGVPDNAAAGAPRGALGLGANYRAANGGQDAGLFPKQAFVRFKGLGGRKPGVAGNSLRLGRFEFWDGGEVVPKNPVLAAVKRDRVAHRLLGNFGFSAMGRSFDGAQLVRDMPSGNFTVLAARPTEGVFQLNGLGEVRKVDFAYAAYTRPMRDSEARLFGLTYRDGRDDVVKTSNNATPIRGDLRINTVGAHFLKAIDTGRATVDLMAWGALQSGDWGALSHRANAFALEAGYQPKSARLRPWLRAGYYCATGDDNPADGKHGTFFSALPTPRAYARFPFYNQMNIEDAFVQGILRPTPKLTVRSEFHVLKLNRAGDLQYAGGGAFSDNSFGYAGRGNPSGKKDLANLLDLSLDYAVDPRTSVTLYGARAFGKGAIQGVFPAGKNATYLYAEVSRKF